MSECGHLERIAALEEALRETIPYVNRRANRADPENAPWAVETAEGVLARIREALDDSNWCKRP